MPTKDRIRLRLIKLVSSSQGPFVRTLLLDKFNPHDRAQAASALSDLISQNVFATTGLGKRGSPVKVIRSAGFPVDHCPMCLQPIKPS